MGIGVAISTLGKVPVETVHDAVLLLLLGSAPRPLTDARSASVGEDVGPHLVEGVEHAIPLQGVPHELRARRDGQLALALHTRVHCRFGQGRAARDVLVAGVGARTDEAKFNLSGVPLLRAQLCHLAHWSGKVWAERTIQVRLQSGEVNLDDLVEVLLWAGIHFCVTCEVLGNAIGQSRHICAARRPQVTAHALIVSKRGSGGADLSAHVANGALSSAAHRIGTLAEVLDDASGSTFGGQDSGHLQNHILRAGPAAHFSGELHADQLGEFELPRHSGHHVYRVGTAHTDGHHAQSSSVHCVAVGSDHHASRKGIVLEHHLVNDAGSRLPESDAVFVGHRLEEVVDLVVAVDGLLQVRIRPHLGLNQVVAVHRRRHCCLGLSGLHELKQGHLCCGILHGHAVRREVHIVLSTAEGARSVSIPQVRVENLLCERQWFAGHLTRRSHSAGETVIHGADHLEIKHVDKG